MKMVTTVSGQSPFAQARFAAITQLAVFEAVNSITKEYEPHIRSIAAPKELLLKLLAQPFHRTILRRVDFPAIFPGYKRKEC